MALRCHLWALLALGLFMPSAASDPNECKMQFYNISTNYYECTLQEWCSDSSDCGERLEMAMKICGAEDAMVWEEEQMANVSVLQLAQQLKGKCGNACYEESHNMGTLHYQGKDEEACARVQDLESKCTSSDKMWEKGNQVEVASWLKRECTCMSTLKSVESCAEGGMANLCNETLPCFQQLQAAEAECGSVVVDEDSGMNVSNLVGWLQENCQTCKVKMMSLKECMSDNSNEEGNETNEMNMHDLIQLCNRTTECGQTLASVLEDCSMLTENMADVCESLECTKLQSEFSQACENQSQTMWCDDSTQCGDIYRRVTDCYMNVPMLHEAGVNMTEMCNQNRCMRHMYDAMSSETGLACMTQMTQNPDSVCDINSECGRKAHSIYTICMEDMPQHSDDSLDMFMQVMHNCAGHGTCKPINAEFAKKINARLCRT